MPYHHIEELGDRSQERYALGLGARNVMGMIVAGFPMLLISDGWPVIIRALAVLLSIGSGFVLTSDAAGMPVYAWPLWWARGRVRMAIQGRIVAPEQLPGVAARPTRPALRAGGPLRPSRRFLAAAPTTSDDHQRIPTP